MSRNRFFISDTHFSHKNICKFMRKDGETPLRPWDDVEEMDEILVQNWNSVVGEHDKVYHLGDVFIPRRGRFILDRLNGKKVLIKGNHDIFALKDYTPWFKDIRAYMKIDDIIFTHVPIHTCNLYRFKNNVHGHLHEHRVLLDDGEIDPRYFSVCVEHINYTPIEFSELREALDRNGEIRYLGGVQ